MMPTSGIVPTPCAAAADGEVQLPADTKHLTRLAGAWARQAVRKKVLEHVALGHGTRVVQHKSSPIAGFSSLPVASLILPATAAGISPPMPDKQMPSSPPPLVKLSPAPSRRLPRVASPFVPVIRDRSWQCHLCTYKQDFVPGSRTCVMCHSTRRLLGVPQHVGKRKVVERTRGRGKSLCYPPYNCPHCRLAERCSACLLTRRKKCINDMWIDAKGPLK